MAIIVNTNMSALKTQNNLSAATSSLNKALERMSTGLKINSSADDAAGMFVASKLETKLRGSKIAQSNIATGINLLNTVEGDLNVINENMARIRDLAVQAANGVYDTDALKAMEDEALARAKEITRVAQGSDFNGIKLLDGTQGEDVRLQIASDSDANTNAIKIDKSIFASAIASTGGLTGITSAAITTAFANASAAATFIGTIDTAMTNIANRKASIGSYVNRLNSASDALVTTIENSSAAKSTITDADVADEAANYTKAQILQQTSAQLLVQAKQLPALALNLIQ